MHFIEQSLFNHVLIEEKEVAIENLLCGINPTSIHLFTIETSSEKFGLITEIRESPLTSGIASSGILHL